MESREAQVQAMRGLHDAANRAVIAFAGTQTATAAATVATGARRKLLSLQGAHRRTGSPVRVSNRVRGSGRTP